MWHAIHTVPLPSFPLTNCMHAGSTIALHRWHNDGCSSWQPPAPRRRGKCAARLRGEGERSVARTQGTATSRWMRAEWNTTATATPKTHGDQHHHRDHHRSARCHCGACCAACPTSHHLTSPSRRTRNEHTLLAARPVDINVLPKYTTISLLTDAALHRRHIA